MLSRHAGSRYHGDAGKNRRVSSRVLPTILLTLPFVSPDFELVSLDVFRQLVGQLAAEERLEAGVGAKGRGEQQQQQQ